MCVGLFNQMDLNTLETLSYAYLLAKSTFYLVCHCVEFFSKAYSVYLFFRVFVERFSVTPAEHWSIKNVSCEMVGIALLCLSNLHWKIRTWQITFFNISKSQGSFAITQLLLNREWHYVCNSQHYYFYPSYSILQIFFMMNVD